LRAAGRGELFRQGLGLMVGGFGGVPEAGGSGSIFKKYKPPEERLTVKAVGRMNSKVRTANKMVRRFGKPQNTTILIRGEKMRKKKGGGDVLLETKGRICRGGGCEKTATVEKGGREKRKSEPS